MIGVFVGLKVRLLRNNLRGQPGVGLVVFTVLVLGVAIGAAIGLWTATAADRLVVAPVLGATLTLAWMLAPLLFGSSDETIDTTRLALYPLDPGALALGMGVAGLIGPGPVAALVPLMAIAWGGSEPTGWVIGTAAAVVTIALATTASRWLLTALGALLRRRRSKDVATLTAGLGAGFLGIGLQLFVTYGSDLGIDELDRVGRIVRWTPFGWSGDALGRAGGGQLLVPLLELAGSVLLLAVVQRWWMRTLGRVLAEVDEGPDLGQLDRHLLRDSWFSRRLPSIATAAAKERRYLRRHPRYRVQVVSQAVVLLVGGAPFLGAVAARNPEAVLLGCIPALTAGVTGSNLIGTDGRSLWAEVVAIDSLGPVLRGRSLAFIGLGLIASVVLTFGVASWTGGWRFVGAALGAAVGMAFSGAGVGSFTSTLAPTVFPDEGNPNPFATAAPGGGCLRGIATFLGVLVGLGASAPILVGLGLTQRDIRFAPVVAVVAPIYGFLVWMGMTRLATRRADRRAPELLFALAEQR